MNILIIDIGTSSMRGTLFSPDGGVLYQHQIKYSVTYGKNGLVEQDPYDWSNALLNIIKDMPEPNLVDTVVLAAQRSSVIPVDKYGKPLMNAIMWQDTRNKEIVNEFQDYAEEILNKTGSKPNTAFSGTKMLWVKRNNPEIYNKTHKFLNVLEFCMYFMTGLYVTDSTYASRSHLMSLKEKKWDRELLSLFGIDENKLCAIHNPGNISGYIITEFSQASGLKQGIPVISAGGDQQCATVGQGAVNTGDISITYGTGFFVNSIVDSIPEKLAPDIICNPSCLPGKYTLETNVWTGASALQWLTNMMHDRKIELKEYDKALEEIYHQDTDCLALPFFRANHSSNLGSNIKATFLNISLCTTKVEIYKALVEGLCIEVANNVDTLKKYHNINKVFIGGGLSNSAIITQIQSDILQRNLYKQLNTECSTVGALLTSSVSLGLYADIKQASLEFFPESTQVEIVPSDDRALYYRKKRAEFNEICRKLNNK